MFLTVSLLGYKKGKLKDCMNEHSEYLKHKKSFEKKRENGNLNSIHGKNCFILLQHFAEHQEYFLFSGK